MATSKTKEKKPVSDKLAGYLDRLFQLTIGKPKKKASPTEK